MIDLHAHTNESDGTFSPAELLQAAADAQLDAIAITDHDTFDGFRIAETLSRPSSLRLVCGIELSTKLSEDGHHPRTVHLLGYWPANPPTQVFVDYVTELQTSRRERNKVLTSRLNSLGIDVALDEVEAIGKSITGRPHFARILVQKGYAASVRDAFSKFLGESAPAFVERESPPIEEAIEIISSSGGISSLAHPIRLGVRDLAVEERLVQWLAERGLPAIECFHSDHSAADSLRYLSYAQKFEMLVTGGSDFHGGNKPDISLGTGRDGTLRVESSLLTLLDEYAVRQERLRAANH